MVEIVQEITRAAIAPLLEPIGWQAFAYGLLGLKTIRKAVNTARGFINGRVQGTDSGDE